MINTAIIKVITYGNNPAIITLSLPTYICSLCFVLCGMLQCSVLNAHMLLLLDQLLAQFSAWLFLLSLPHLSTNLFVCDCQ